MSLYKRKETYWVYIRHEGERIRRSTGTNDRKKAQKIHDELKAQLWKKKHSGKTWQDACVAWLAAAPRSASEAYSLRSLDYPDRPLSECTIESFNEALEGKSAATFNRYRSMINAILNHAKKIGWVENVVTVPSRKVKAKGFRFLTADEWAKLHQELPEHLQAPARFALATGLRQDNVTGLEWSRVDLNRKLVWVLPEHTKSNKPIGIPLSDEAVEILRGQLQAQAERRKKLKEKNEENGKPDTWVFTYRGKRIGKIKTAWNAARKRAGLMDFRWHDFRHTFATWHVMSGTPLEVLQKLGGWKDLRMVMRYAHLSQGYISGFANNAKPFVNAAEDVA